MDKRSKPDDEQVIMFVKDVEIYYGGLTEIKTIKKSKRYLFNPIMNECFRALLSFIKDNQARDSMSRS